MNTSFVLLLDGLLLLAYFSTKCALLHLLLKLIAKDTAKTGLFRMILITALISSTYCFATIQFPYATTLLPGGILVLIAILLTRFLFATSWGKTLLISLVFTAISMTTDYLGAKLSDKILPEEQRLTDYIFNPSRNTDIAPQENSDSNSVNEDQPNLDAASLTSAIEKMNAMKREFSSGVKLFETRKDFMDSMDESEMMVYRNEMTSFIKKQNLATDRYALAALQHVNQSDVYYLVALLAQKEPPASISSMSDALNTMTGNTDITIVQPYAKLLVEKNKTSSIKTIRKMITKSEGKNKLEGTVLATLLQSDSGLPAALMFSDESRSNDSDGIQRVPVPVNLGIVRVPLSSSDCNDWMTVAQTLQVKGFLTSAQKTVILLDNSQILSNSEIWEVEYNGYLYGFKIEEVWNGMVYLSTISRKKR